MTILRGVYEISCKDCHQKYVGQTRKSVKTRVVGMESFSLLINGLPTHPCRDVTIHVDEVSTQTISFIFSICSIGVFENLITDFYVWSADLCWFYFRMRFEICGICVYCFLLRSCFDVLGVRHVWWLRFYYYSTCGTLLIVPFLYSLPYLNVRVPRKLTYWM